MSDILTSTSQDTGDAMIGMLIGMMILNFVMSEAMTTMT